MRVQIDADTKAHAAQVEQLLRFYLTVLDGDVEAIEIKLDAPPDPLGLTLYRCRVDLAFGMGRSLDIQETQASLALATTRALDRAVRTLRRRLPRYRMSRSA